MEAEAEGKYIRQSGGRGQYGHAVLIVTPRPRGEGVTFTNKIVGGTIPKEFINPIEKGVREALDNGVIAGFSMIDLDIAVIDGSFHEVDSSEMAFKIAGSMAVQDAVKRAGPVVLEPIMKVEVTTPEANMGDIIGDLSARRAQIGGTAQRGNARVITAIAPLSELSAYATAIRSLTAGRASYYMEPSHYQELPNSLATKLLKNSTK